MARKRCRIGGLTDSFALSAARAWPLANPPRSTRSKLPMSLRIMLESKANGTTDPYVVSGFSRTLDDPHGRVSRTTASAISRRYASSFRGVRRDVARIATASNLALAAPRHRCDGRHRYAFRHLDGRQERIDPVQRRALHGNADDRQHGVAATTRKMRRRRARDDHLSPRPDALDASAVSAGVRCADNTRHSCETPKRVSISSAWRMASQSDLLPMMIPTRGAGSAMHLFHHEQHKGHKRERRTQSRWPE